MFSRRQLSTLSIITLLIVAAAVWIGMRSQQTEAPVTTATKVLPTLTGKLNDVNELRIVKGGDKTVVTLKRAGGADQKDSWQVADRAGYPADFAKVRELLLKLGELEVVEEKTNKPESYPALGVEDLKDEKAGGKRVDLMGITPPVAVIVGKNGSAGGNYVRVSGTERSVLAKPQISISDEPGSWLNRTLLDIPAARIQEVRLANIAPAAPVGSGDDKTKDKSVKPVPRAGSYVITREQRDQNDFAIPGIPKDKKLSSPGAPSAVAGALANLELDDVRPFPKDESWSKNAEVSTAEYRFFDGTVLKVQGSIFKQDKKGTDTFGGADQHWVHFTVSFDEAQNTRFKPKAPAAAPAADKNTAPPATANKTPTAGADSNPEKSPGELREAAQKLDARVEQWAYEIPSYKFESIFKPLDGMLETIAKNKPGEKNKTDKQ